MLPFPLPPKFWQDRRRRWTVLLAHTDFQTQRRHHCVICKKGRVWNLYWFLCTEMTFKLDRKQRTNLSHLTQCVTLSVSVQCSTPEQLSAVVWRGHASPAFVSWFQELVEFGRIFLKFTSSCAKDFSLKCNFSVIQKITFKKIVQKLSRRRPKKWSKF